MKSQHLVLALVGGLILGGVVVALLGPCFGGQATPLVDGKYLVIEGEDGHWVYEKGDDGFSVVLKEISPAGLKAIWELQGDYMPQSLKIGGDDIISVPATRYSTETRSFQVIHKFYRVADDKLIELPMENVPVAQPAPPR